MKLVSDAHRGRRPKNEKERTAQASIPAFGSIASEAFSGGPERCPTVAAVAQDRHPSRTGHNPRWNPPTKAFPDDIRVSTRQGIPTTILRDPDLRRSRWRGEERWIR
jgi:hypothetical protein